jgi:hypothetical protein
VADERLDEYVLEGESLLGLPSDNPAYISVKEMLQKLEYLPP